MLETIKNLLDREKYHIIEEKDKIEISGYIGDTKMANPEDYVQVEFINNKYAVYNVSRGKRYLECETKDKIYFTAFAYIYIDKLLSNKRYIYSPDGRIYLLLVDNKVEEARILLEKNLNPKYASIDKVERDKICLIKREKDSAVIYNERLIKDNIEFTEGFNTLLIRSKYLERFEILFNKLKKSLPVDRYYNKLLDYYVFDIEINCSTSSE